MKDLSVVLEEVARERSHQAEQWPTEAYAERPFEEWLILAHVYMKEALSEYAHKPGKEAAREKLVKVASLALWGLQCDKNTD